MEAALTAEAPPRISVVIIEDHTLLRDAIRSFVAESPDLSIVGEATTADEGANMVATRRPDVALLDINLPGKSGLQAARRIRAESPDTRVLILTAYDYPQYVRATLELGARGYLLKSATAEQVVAALRAVGRGETVLDPAIARSVARAMCTLQPGELSEREVQVLRLVARGLRNHEIATELSIALSTVETHIKNIFEKLDATNRTQAVDIARRSGLLHEEPGA